MELMMKVILFYFVFIFPFVLVIAGACAINEKRCAVAAKEKDEAQKEAAKSARTKPRT